MQRPALLFDLLGTLLDESSDYEALDAAMEAACARFGIADQAESLSGDFSLALMEILRAGDAAADAEGGDEEPAEFVPFEQAAKEIFAAVLEVRGVRATPRDVHWFWDTYLAIQKRVFRAYPDALPALEMARSAGHKVWVVTDADPYMITHILPATGLHHVVDGAVTAFEAGYPKPHPRLFEHALDRAGVNPVNAVFVGDSYERDILGARGAGIRGILLDRRRVRTVRDVPVIASLASLPRALSALVPSLS